MPATLWQPLRVSNTQCAAVPPCDGDAGHDRRAIRARGAAGVASGIDNAVARVAGLLAIAALGAVVAATFASPLDASLAQAARPAAVARASGQLPAHARAGTTSNEVTHRLEREFDLEDERLEI